MSEKKELSQLARQLLGNSNAVEFYTQQEFDEALAIAQAEIMTVAVETTKQALLIERGECAKMAEADGHADLAERIRNRIPSQRI